MKLLVVRHAQSTWNARHRWAGQRDPGLSAEGRAAAAALATRLGALRSPAGAVASSDLRRARQTAGILAQALRLPPPTILAGLREWDAGEWTARTSRQIEAGWPGELDRWRRGELVDPPGSELWDAFTDRVLAALTEVAGMGVAAPVVVVAHQGVLRALEHHFGVRPRPAAGLGGVWLRTAGRQMRWAGHW
ncbi:MAG TPA: histidine phosphatase family protein [Actinomycetota bacterium]|nr:histidine phosphatase family protein [Actinomycetota bacterium]